MTLNEKDYKTNSDSPPLQEAGEMSVQSKVELFAPNFSLKKLTDKVVTMEDGSIFQYLIILTEKIDPLLRRWLLPCQAKTMKE